MANDPPTALNRSTSNVSRSSPISKIKSGASATGTSIQSSSRGNKLPSGKTSIVSSNPSISGTTSSGSISKQANEISTAFQANTVSLSDAKPAPVAPKKGRPKRPPSLKVPINPKRYHVNQMKPVLTEQRESTPSMDSARPSSRPEFVYTPPGTPSWQNVPNKKLPRAPFLEIAALPYPPELSPRSQSRSEDESEPRTTSSEGKYHGPLPERTIAHPQETLSSVEVLPNLIVLADGIPPFQVNTAPPIPSLPDPYFPRENACTHAFTDALHPDLFPTLVLPTSPLHTYVNCQGCVARLQECHNEIRFLMSSNDLWWDDWRRELWWKEEMRTVIRGSKGVNNALLDDQSEVSVTVEKGNGRFWAKGDNVWVRAMWPVAKIVQAKDQMRAENSIFCDPNVMKSGTESKMTVVTLVPATTYEDDRDREHKSKLKLAGRPRPPVWQSSIANTAEAYQDRKRRREQDKEESSDSEHVKKRMSVGAAIPTKQRITSTKEPNSSEKDQSQKLEGLSPATPKKSKSGSRKEEQPSEGEVGGKVPDQLHEMTLREVTDWIENGTLPQALTTPMSLE